MIEVDAAEGGGELTSPPPPCDGVAEVILLDGVDEATGSNRDGEWLTEGGAEEGPSNGAAEITSGA